MRVWCILLFLSCSSPSKDLPTSSLSPVTTPASTQAAVIAPVKSLDMSGEFTIRFDDQQVVPDPTDETLIIRSDGSIELQERVEIVSKRGVATVVEHKAPGKITKAMLTSSELASIRFAVASEDFFMVEDLYRGKMYDVPSLTFSIETPTQKKRISMYGMLFRDTPPALQTAVIYTKKVARDQLAKTKKK